MTDNKEKTLPAPAVITDCWNTIGVWGNSPERCARLEELIHCHNCEVYSNAGRMLLNRAAPSGYEDEWTDVLSKEIVSPAENLESVVVFRLGTEWLALPVVMIKEITLMRDICDLPHNNNLKLRGIVNIRGELVICMSLGYLMGVEKPDEDWLKFERSISRLIMMREGSGYIVFPVSEVHGIARHLPEELNKAPDTIKKTNLSFIKGIIKWKGNNVGCIDETALTNEVLSNLK
ncbi:chemotaxis protein CheW [Sulfuriflexus mobilis]|uniref:chemotaxis protein CheW n=1 Tax=Sulfuriflexus mobilis TaxID=1811807 RepID=UPI000F84B103|nr:chemotaxis protein CheW [Sulfuriflexus mobilis]